jgi:hypothetical protein
MSMPSEPPYASNPGSTPRPDGASGRQPGVRGALLASLAIVLGSLIVGLAGGLIWAAVAPRAVYEVVTHGSAYVINPETTAFIAADGVYCIIGAVGGVIIGLAGYLLAVRRYGPAPMAAVVAGSVLAAIVARWIGERSGLTTFNHQLLTSPLGTHLRAPLALSGDTSAATWPTLHSLPAVSFWPLTACIVAGGLTLLVVLRERSSRHAYEVTYPGPQQPYGTLPGS